MKEKTPARFTKEAEDQGCLCFAKRLPKGWEEHHPDACPLHGWRPDASPERLQECLADKVAHLTETQQFIARRGA